MSNNPEFQSDIPATLPAGVKPQVRAASSGDGLVQAVYLDGSNTVTATDGGGALTIDGAISFVDENGAAYGVKHVNNKPRVSSMPYLYDIAEGNIAGHTEFERFAYNADIDIASEDIWTAGGVYVWPAIAQQMELVSTSAADDGNPLGTGVGVVTIYYLTADGTAATEDVTLNGTGVVTTTAQDIYRVNSMKAKTVGTGGAAAGVISIRNFADTPVYSQIEVGNTRSRNSMYTVPKGKTLYITSMFAGLGYVSSAANPSNSAMVTLRATYDHEAVALRAFFMPHAEIQVGSGGGGVVRPFEIPMKFPAGTDIKVSATTSANNGQVSVGLRGWLE